MNATPTDNPVGKCRWCGKDLYPTRDPNRHADQVGEYICVAWSSGGRPAGTGVTHELETDPDVEMETADPQTHTTGSTDAGWAGTTR